MMILAFPVKRFYPSPMTKRGLKVSEMVVKNNLHVLRSDFVGVPCY